MFQFAVASFMPTQLRSSLGVRPQCACHIEACAGSVVVGPSLTGKELDTSQPSADLEVRDVIDTMMSCLHRINADLPNRPYFGCEVALRFLAPTHQAAAMNPAGFNHYMRQPHKQSLHTWNEYDFAGDVVIIQRKDHPWEAYQQVKVRANADSEWASVRWLLIKQPEGLWLVDGVFADEPDQLNDDEFSTSAGQNPSTEPVAFLDPKQQQALFSEFDIDGSGAIGQDDMKQIVANLGIGIGEDDLIDLMNEIDTDGSGSIEYDEFTALLAEANAGCEKGNFACIITNSVHTETPRQIVEEVMRALRSPNDSPSGRSENYGPELAIRYCSPTNRASGLTPQGFARYLEEPWYRLLLEWDEIELSDDEEDLQGSTTEEEVLVRRKGEDSWSIVSYQLSRYNGRWLIDSISIQE